MQKAFKYFKTVVIQVCIFLVLLIFVNWIAGAYLKRLANTKREALPNYSASYDYAQKIFRDYNSVQHEYEPFVGWKMKPYKGETLNVTENGERNTLETNSSDSARSVHFFGGSTMWGEGSDDRHTIPSLFSVNNPHYNVYNHAQLAYNSRQELDALISMYTTNQKMDVVIFYDGVNDAAFLCPKEISELPSHRLVPMYREKLYAGKMKIINDLASKLFVENTLKVVRMFANKSGKADSPYDCITNPEKAEQIAEIMMRNWEIAQELVAQHNGKFLAVLQPAAYIGKPRTDHLKLDEDLGENFKAIYDRLKEKIKERNHSWVLDLTDKFNNNEYIYIDFCHVSPNGNEIIAKEISGALKQNRKINEDVSLLAIHP